MINQKEVLEAIAEYLGVGPADIDRHANLREDLNLGPIEINDLLGNLTERFGVTFDPEDLSDLETIDELLVLVEDNSI